MRNAVRMMRALTIAAGLSAAFLDSSWAQNRTYVGVAPIGVRFLNGGPETYANGIGGEVFYRASSAAKPNVVVGLGLQYSRFEGNSSGTIRADQGKMTSVLVEGRYLLATESPVFPFLLGRAGGTWWTSSGSESGQTYTLTQSGGSAAAGVGIGMRSGPVALDVFAAYNALFIGSSKFDAPGLGSATSSEKKFGGYATAGVSLSVRLGGGR